MKTFCAALAAIVVFAASLAAAEAPAAAAAAPAAQRAQQPLADYFGADTLAYADCPSVPAFIEGAKGTGLYALWYDDSMAKLRAYVDESLAGEDAAGGWKGLSTLRDFAAGLPGRLAVGVSQGAGSIEWLIVADVTDEAAARAAVAALNTLAPQSGKPSQEVVLSGVKVSISPDGKRFWAVADGLVFLGSHTALAGALERRASQSHEGALSASVNFTRASAFFSNGPAAYRVVLDLPTLMAKLKTAAAGLPVDLDALLTTVGVSDVETVSFEGAFKYSGVIEHVYVSTKTAESKLIDLVGRTPLDESRLTVAPRTALVASMRTFDAKACWDCALEVMKLVGPAAGIDVPRLIADFERRTGVKIKEDVVNALGRTLITYTDVPEGASLEAVATGGGVNEAMLMEVTDGDKINQTIDKFAAVAQADPTFLGPAFAAGGARIEVTTLGTLKITSIVLAGKPMVSPSVAVSNGFLIYAGNKETLKAIVDRLIAPGKSIVDTPDYARVRSALSKQAVQLAYVNIDRLVDFFYEVGVPEISRRLDAANLNGQTTLTSAAIPPAYVVKKSIDGIGVSVSASGNLIDAQVYSPFGCAIVIPAAVVLPALAADLHAATPRQLARSLESTGAAGSDIARDRLVQIGTKLQLSTIERKGRFPDRIEDVVSADMLKAPQALENAPGGDYVYVPGLTMNSPGKSVLVYERKGLQSEGRHVLFVDGSVELLSEEDFAKLPGVSASK